MYKLTLVPTPLGNLEDITLRSLRYIFETPVALCEDTRNYFKLKELFRERFNPIMKEMKIVEIDQKVVSYRDQNHKEVILKIYDQLQKTDVILLTDAGTPGISDPGNLLVRDLIQLKCIVDALPGASSLNLAISLSGNIDKPIKFVGFLGRQEKEILKTFTDRESAIVFFESPERITKTVSLISDDLNLVLYNDLTKLYQLILRGKPSELLEKLKSSEVRGEWCGVTF